MLEKETVNSVSKPVLSLCFMFTIAYSLGEGECEHRTKIMR